jgi:hypothetical protein
MDTNDTEYVMRMEHPTIKGKEYLEWCRPEVGKKHDADLGMASNRNLTKAQYLNAELA